MVRLPSFRLTITRLGLEVSGQLGNFLLFRPRWPAAISTPERKVESARNIATHLDYLIAILDNRPLKFKLILLF